MNINVTSEVQARNRQEIENIIGQCLEQVIRGFLPWQAITKKYFKNSEPTDFIKPLPEPEPEEEKKAVSFEEESEDEDEEEEQPRLTISEEDATLDIPELEEKDPMKELEEKVEETLVLNL
jgi:hypothetical protein